MCVCVSLCLCYVCLSRGEDGWRGPQILWESVIGRELGLRECEAEVDEGEKDKLEDGRAEKVEAEG